MQDPLDAIRRIYGEPGAAPERLPPEAQAESDALSTLKVGLDALPPRRPDAATLDAVLEMAERSVERDEAFAALRAVYGDDAEGAGTSEAAALAEAKAGLDALPPRRPDAATLETVFAAAEAAPLAPLRAAYGESDAETDSPEAATFAALKTGLDALPPRRPEAATLEAVFAAGAPTSPDRVVERAADRAPQRLVTRRRMVVALGAAFALTLVLTSGLWLPDGTLPVAPDEEQALVVEGVDEETERMDEPSSKSVDAVEAPLVAEATPPPAVAGGAVASVSPAPPAARQSQAVSAPTGARSDPARSRRALAPEEEEAGDVAANLAMAAMPPAPSDADEASFADGNLVGEGVGDLALAADEELPLADGEEALRRLYLRTLELQAAQAGLGWDQPPDALGAAPDSLPTGTGWMQVRVER